MLKHITSTTISFYCKMNFLPLNNPQSLIVNFWNEIDCCVFYVLSPFDMSSYLCKLRHNAIYKLYLIK